MAKLESLITLEEALANRIIEDWGPYARQRQAEIKNAIDRRDFGEARRIIEKFSMDDIMEKNRGFAEFIFTSALLLGASRLVPMADTIIAEEGPPEEIFKASMSVFIEGMKASIETVKRVTTKVVEAEIKGIISDEDVKIAKSDCCDEHVFKAVNKSLADRLGAAVFGGGKAVVNIGANLTTSRLISYGFLAQAKQSGKVSYQVTEVLDSRTCPVCRHMHGKVFTVHRAMSRLSSVLQNTDFRDLSAAQPFPNQSKAGLITLFGMSKKDMQARGWDTPPYHPICRGTLVPTGGAKPLTIRQQRRPSLSKVKPSIQEPPPLTPEELAINTKRGKPFTTAEEYFERFDIKGLTPEQILAEFPADVARDMRKFNAAIEKAIKGGKETQAIHSVQVTHADGTIERIYSKARQKKHNEIINKLMNKRVVKRATPKPGEKPRFVVLGGRGGSGKSALTTARNKGGLGLINEKKFIVLNVDDIKLKIPEYKGWNAYLTHEESSDIMSRMLEIARKKNLNVILDATMRNTKSVLKNVSKFEALGYDIEGYYMHLPRDQAARRAISRFRTFRLDNSGRYVPPDVVLSNIANEASFDKLIPKFKRWAMLDNNVPLGDRPILLAGNIGKLDPGVFPRHAKLAEKMKLRVTNNLRQVRNKVSGRFQTLGTTSIQDAIKVANEHNLQTVTTAETFAKRFRGTARFPPLAGQPPTTIKQFDSIERKLRRIKGIKGTKGLSSITDVSRASIAFDNVDDVYQAANAMASELNVVKITDRFLNPAPDGYRAIIMRVKNPQGYIYEIQFHIREMLEYKFIQGHEYYLKAQAVLSRAKQFGRGTPAKLTLKERAEWNRWNKLAQEGYDKRFKIAVDRLKRIG